ncbi:MAG TPA: hypothetical protein VFQ44_00775 [Streptosporangiaceae bacterium]|nr:hypothetical protein [Streptosporangiaceae bacterium]
MAQLGLVQSIHPRWTGISALRERLLRGDLGEGLAEALLDFQQDVADGSAAGGWPEKVSALRQSLHDLGAEVTMVTGTLLRASAWRRSDPASPLLKSGAARPDLASLPRPPSG